MKNNQGITLITLVITIIVIILLASITIYTGMNTVSSVRKKNATDTVNAIYLALVANEDIIPISSGETIMLANSSSVTNRQLTDADYRKLGLTYTEDKYKVVFDRTIQDENTIVYTFRFTDDLGNTYDNLIYKYYKELSKTNTKAEFDSVKKVNRPILFESDMVPYTTSGDVATEVKNVYLENWYNYEKGATKLATMQYKGNTYAWIPRFAYRIQSFYSGRALDDVPATAIDIVFLRDDTWYMPNGEVISKDYVVHPAFSDGQTGFWIMLEPAGTQNSIANAVNDGESVKDSNNASISHLMKNSEYAAAIFLSRCLGNSEIKFTGKEYVAAGCDLSGSSYEDFDVYSLNDLASNYFNNIKGQALMDTPWNLKEDSVYPDEENIYILRDVEQGGEFYFKAYGGITDAYYRMVIPR